MNYHCKLLESKRLQYQRKTRTRSRWLFVDYVVNNHDIFRRYSILLRALLERVPGCVPVKVERKLERFGTRMERKWNANGTQMERKWNVNGTQMERKWNANGTHLRTRSGRVPNAFSVRLFLSSTVCFRI